jgi:hypothetical protein
LISEVERLRAGIREHRDSTGHDLCWHHPKLWGLLPERVTQDLAVPAWPQFLRGLSCYGSLAARNRQPLRCKPEETQTVAFARDF